MADNLFEPPWVGENPILHERFPAISTIDEVITRLENLLRQREGLSCPNDDVDNRILWTVRCVLDSVKPLVSQQELSNTHKNVIIMKSRLSIEEANEVIEKTLKLRF